MEETRFAAFDIDQTMYRWSLFLDLIDALVDDGLMDPSVRDGASVERRRWENRESSYDEYLEKQVRLYCDYGLRGMFEHEIIRVSRVLMERKHKRQYLFTRELLKSLRSCGYKIVAISGSPIQVVKIFAQAWGFDQWIGTELEVNHEGRFTGDDTKTIRHFLRKGELFERLREQLGCIAHESVAVGDAISDYPMLMQADFPIAFNPEQALEDHARASGISIVKERTSVINAFQTHVSGGASPLGREGLVEVSVHDILPDDVATQLQEHLARNHVKMR